MGVECISKKRSVGFDAVFFLSFLGGLMHRDNSSVFKVYTLKRLIRWSTVRVWSRAAALYHMLKWSM